MSSSIQYNVAIEPEVKLLETILSGELEPTKAEQKIDELFTSKKFEMVDKAFDLKSRACFIDLLSRPYPREMCKMQVKAFFAHKTVLSGTKLAKATYR